MTTKTITLRLVADASSAKSETKAAAAEVKGLETAGKSAAASQVALARAATQAASSMKTQAAAAAAATSNLKAQAAAAAAAANASGKQAASAEIYRDSLGRLRAANGRFLSDAQRAALGLDRQAEKASKAARSTDALSRSSDLAATAARGLAAAAAAVTLAFGAGALARAQTQIDAITRSLDVALGSSEASAKALAYLRSEADRLGQNLPRAAGAFASLQAAAKGTSLEGRGAAQIFAAVNQAMTALGKTPEVAEGALLALEQMISKGTVSAEELRGQLGERLPGAFQIAAKAMNLTTAELGDALQKGEIMAEDLLPRLAVALEQRFAGAAEQAADSLQANVNRMRTALFNLQATINQAGAADVLNAAAKSATGFIDQVSALIGAQRQAFSSAPAVDWGLAIDSVTKQVVLFFGRIPDFVRGMVSLIAVDVAYMAESFGIGFRAAGVLAQRALQGIKDAAIVAVNAALEAVKRLGEGAASALDQFGASELASKLRNGVAAITDFQTIIGEQAAANRSRLDDERDALVAAQANAKQAHAESQRYLIETIAGNEDARQAALDHAGSVKRVGLEALNAADGFQAAAVKATELTNAQKAAAKAADQASKSLRDRLEDLRNENALIAEGYTLERAREELRVRAEAATAGFSAQRLAEYLTQLRELSGTQETLLTAQKAANDALEEEARIRARNTQSVREHVAELEAEVAALLAGAAAAAKYQAERAKLIAQGATPEQAEDATNLSRVRDTVTRNRDLSGLDALSFDDILDLSPAFDALDDLALKLEGLGDVGSESMKQIALATKAFAVAGKSSGREAFGAYTQGAAASLAAVQSFTKQGSSAYEKLGIAIQALHTVTAVQAALNAFATAPFPANFAALAAALAAIASLGVSIGGASGGVASAPSQVSRANLNDGTGTVLGNPSARSESIANSLKQLEKFAEIDIGYSAQQLQTLRSISAALTGVSSLLFRSNIGTGGATPFNAAGTTAATGLARFGAATSAASLVSKIPVFGELSAGLMTSLATALLGRISTEQIGTGLILRGGQQLGDVLSRGLDAVYFQAIRETRRSFFGLVSSSSTREVTTGIGEDLARQLGLVLGGLADSAVAAAGALGGDVQQARQRLNALSLGQVRIDLQGLSAEDAQERLEAVFGAIGDTIAQSLVPRIVEFQRAGEGAFETLNRVASETRVVQQRLDSLGLALGQLTGLDLARVGQQLIDLAGGAENFIANTGTFFSEFYSDEEQTESLRQQLVEAVDALGFALPAARAGFRELISSLDLTAEQGQRAFTQLTGLAGAADRYYDTLDDAMERYADAAKGLRDFRESMRSIAETANGVSLIAARQRFDSTSRLARLGNLDALQSLPDLGRALASASQAQALTRTDYLRDLARIRLTASQAESVATRLSLSDLAAQQLAEQKAQTALLSSINDAIVPMASAAPGASGDSASELAALREEVADLKRALHTIAVNTGKTADRVRWIEDWDAEGLPKERAA